MPIRRTVVAAVAFALAGLATNARAQNAAPEAMSFTSADGVKLQGQFYKSPKGAAMPVVLMLHDYQKKPDEAAWTDTAKLLVEKGYNVFRFDFRGHGKSTDIDPTTFWDTRTVGGFINRQFVKIPPGLTVATKNTIKFDEFRHDKYYPMLVQDIAAARNQIDQLNDTGTLNSSTIYLLGAGNAASLGMLYISSEWLRENKKPNVAVPPQIVSTRRNLFPSHDPAGPDIGGAIWLSPLIHNSMTTTNLVNWVLSPHAIKMRNETPMLFIHSENDSTAKTASNTMFNKVLLVDAKIGPRGEKLLKPEQTFQREVKGKLSGVNLLGNTTGAEKFIEDFLASVDKERKNKTRKVREWDKPLIIDVKSFGVSQ